MELIYVLIGVAILLGAYFLFFKKSEPEQISSAESRPELPQKKPEAKAPPKKAEPEPAEAKPEAEPSPPPAPERISVPAPSKPPPPSGRKPVPSPEPPKARPRDIEGLRRGLAKSRSDEGFFGKLRALFVGKKEISADIARDIEEILLTSDVGVETTQLLLGRVKQALDGSDLADPEKVWQALRDEARQIVSVDGLAGPLELKAKPTVILMVGVNGAGKTTTIGKLATKLQAQGKKCVLAAADTFRAAAVQQLVVWGQRVGCEVVRGKDGADPGSVVFDAIKKAEEIGADVVLADTAGRLHTKSNLMSEMKKIAKTAEKAMPGAPHEILLVIDATNGQNALQQAKEFKETLPLSGIVLTKLDGTAKGGVVIGIAHTLRLPVRFIGLGERPDDLHEFSPDDFVEALLGQEAGESA